jgi:hypothetical protein
VHRRQDREALDKPPPHPIDRAAIADRGHQPARDQRDQKISTSSIARAPVRLEARIIEWNR